VSRSSTSRDAAAIGNTGMIDIGDFLRARCSATTLVAPSVRSSREHAFSWCAAPMSSASVPGAMRSGRRSMSPFQRGTGLVVAGVAGDDQFAVCWRRESMAEADGAPIV
jgi:hypothetical protein